MLRRISVNTQTGGSRPEAFITKGKQRLKQNIDTVYLSNGDEFEVELYNPTQNKVLAKIEMNGNSIGAGVILRPGERIFLERFLNGIINSFSIWSSATTSGCIALRPLRSPGAFVFQSPGQCITLHINHAASDPMRKKSSASCKEIQVAV